MSTHKSPLLVAILFAIAASAAHANCTPQAASWITLEVIASEPAGDEPVEVIDIDHSGCATLRYASFDRRAGLYRRQLSLDERKALAGEIDRRSILRFDSAATRHAIAQRERRFRAGLLATDAPAAGAERFRVECGDTYRLRIDDTAGAVQIEWYAPKQIATRHREVTALTDLVAMIESLQTLAASEARIRIADVTP